MKISRRIALSALAAAAALGLASHHASAQTQVKVGYTAVTSFGSLFAAKEEGFFSKRGLDVEPVLIGLTSNIPPAVVANSVQFGGTTPPTFIQAVDGGLDLVTVAGGSIGSQDDIKGVGIVVRPESGINKPEDMIGKKIGAPGLGAYLHVLFREYLRQKKIDPKKINFVEVSFPTMNDILKAGTVDGVVTADPFMARIVGSGTGKVLDYYLEAIPDGKPAILYTATPDYIKKNPQVVKAFQEAIMEGAAFVNANKEKTRAHIAKYIKLPPEVMATVSISRAKGDVSTAELDWWLEVMASQDMLQGKLQSAKLIAK